MKLSCIIAVWTILWLSGCGYISRDDLLKRDIGEPLFISSLVEISKEKSVIYFMENGVIVKKTTEYDDGAVIDKRDDERTGFFTLKAISAEAASGGWGEGVPIRERVPRLEGITK